MARSRPLRALLTAVFGLALLAPIASCDRGAGSGAIRLEVWTLALRPGFVDYMESLCAGFEEANPGVEVVWVDVPFNAISRKLVAAAAAKRGPDVLNLSDRDFARFAALGALRPLDDLLPGDPAARYVPGALDSLVLDGQRLALPWYLTTSVRLVNQNVLEQAGISPGDLPGDWAGLRNLARDYHQATGGFFTSVSLGDTSELPVMMMGDGVIPFAEQDGRVVAKLNTDEVAAYIQPWVDLYRAGALPRAAATRDHSHLVEMYQEGRLALVQTGPNMLNRIQDGSPEVFAGTAVMQPVTGRLGRGHVAIMTLGVGSQAEHPELAAKLAWWITSPDAQLELSRKAPVLPSALQTLADDYFQPAGGASEGALVAAADTEADAKKAAGRVASAQALATAVAFTPALDAWPDLRRHFDEGMKRVLLENADLRTTLAEIEAHWDDELRVARPAPIDVVPAPDPVGVAPLAARGSR
ncbi:MAG: extracellular solute-binding protein [Planctomycetota bacterium]